MCRIQICSKRYGDAFKNTMSPQPLFSERGYNYYYVWKYAPLPIQVTVIAFG